MSLVTPAYAQCPVCIITVGGGMILAKKLGLDDLIASIWIAGLNTVIAFYLATKIKKTIFKNPYILASVTNSITLIYFYVTNQANSSKIPLGQILGFLAVSLALLTDKYIRFRRNGQVLFYYQKVVIPLAYLILFTLFSQYIFL
jgi:hypothetical protein